MSVHKVMLASGCDYRVRLNENKPNIIWGFLLRQRSVDDLVALGTNRDESNI